MHWETKKIVWLALLHYLLYWGWSGTKATTSPRYPVHIYIAKWLTQQGHLTYSSPYVITICVCVVRTFTIYLGLAGRRVLETDLPVHGKNGLLKWVWTRILVLPSISVLSQQDTYLSGSRARQYETSITHLSCRARVRVKWWCTQEAQNQPWGGACAYSLADSRREGTAEGWWHGHPPENTLWGLCGRAHNPLPVLDGPAEHSFMLKNTGCCWAGLGTQLWLLYLLSVTLAKFLNLSAHVS